MAADCRDRSCVLRVCCTSSEEMEDEQDEADDEDDVDETGGYVECEKAEQPKNDENCGDDPKHVFISLFPSARKSAFWLFRTG